MFNHESPLRGETFVTRKITRALGRIYHKIQSNLSLGNLDASRDWGFAGDYVRCWMMLTRQSRRLGFSNRRNLYCKFLAEAFHLVDLDWKDYVIIDKKYERPNEVKHLLGDSKKAEKNLAGSQKLVLKT